MAVEFCTQCKQSLPRGDVSFKNGQAFTSHDYICPNCGKVANPGKDAAKSAPEPGPEQDVVIRDGESSTESA